MDAIKTDLPVSMTMAAFCGIAWYIGTELNFSLFVLFKRWRGRYFWSCALGSWGIILHPLFIILADFEVWTDLKGSILMIYLTGFLMILPQSWALYSRLHLLTRNTTLLHYVRGVLLFTSIVIPPPTIVIGFLAVSFRELATSEIENPNAPRTNAGDDRSKQPPWARPSTAPT